MNRPRAVFAIAVAVLLFAAFFGTNPHPHFWWDEIPAFSALLGFAGAWLLVILAKSVASPLLQRPDEEDGE
jgi:hypothetical protein